MPISHMYSYLSAFKCVISTHILVHSHILMHLKIFLYRLDLHTYIFMEFESHCIFLLASSMEQCDHFPHHLILHKWYTHTYVCVTSFILTFHIIEYLIYIFVIINNLNHSRIIFPIILFTTDFTHVHSQFTFSSI